MKFTFLFLEGSPLSPGEGPGVREKGVSALLASLLLLLFSHCTRVPAQYGTQTSGAGIDFQYERYRPDSVNRPAEYTFTPSRNYVAENYYPDTNNLKLLPVRTVRVNVHLMNSADTLYKYHGKVGADYTRQVIEACNDLLSKHPDLWITPPEQDVDSPPRQLRIALAQDPDTGEDAIYDHFDDEYYGYLHKGRNANRGDRGVIKRYGTRQDEELNLFFMGPPRDSFLSKTFRVSSSSGIFVGNAIKIAGFMAQDVTYWNHRFVIVHEILHALGLGHAWTRSDGCDDTPIHKNDCWDPHSKPHCDTMTSNNIMDYSYRQEALTPCQIGRIHARLSTIGTRQRDWLVRDWCEYRADQPVTIRTTTEITGNRDYHSDVYVERGGTLRIDGRVHLPAGGGIYVAPGAALKLGPSAILHNDCGGEWAGIFVGRSPSGSFGTVITQATTTFLNEAE